MGRPVNFSGNPGGEKRFSIESDPRWLIIEIEVSLCGIFQSFIFGALPSLGSTRDGVQVDDQPIKSSMIRFILEIL